MADNSKFMVGNEMRPFFNEVTKAFAEHAGKDEFVKFHGPETHPGEPLHSQTMLINTTTRNAYKIKSKE